MEKQREALKEGKHLEGRKAIRGKEEALGNMGRKRRNDVDGGIWESGNEDRLTWIVQVQFQSPNSPRR